MTDYTNQEIEAAAAFLYTKATGEPWTVAGVEHKGPDRDYYRKLARKFTTLRAAIAASLVGQQGDESAQFHLWAIDEHSKQQSTQQQARLAVVSNEKPWLSLRNVSRLHIDVTKKPLAVFHVPLMIGSYDIRPGIILHLDGSHLRLVLDEAHVLVPRDPTEAMKEAGNYDRWRYDDAEDIYRAMVAAAPASQDADENP